MCAVDFSVRWFKPRCWNTFSTELMMSVGQKPLCHRSNGMPCVLYKRCANLALLLGQPSRQNFLELLQEVITNFSILQATRTYNNICRTKTKSKRAKRLLESLDLGLESFDSTRRHSLAIQSEQCALLDVSSSRSSPDGHLGRRRAALHV